MLPAQKVQKACPQCAAQVFNLFENAFTTTPVRAIRASPSTPIRLRGPTTRLRAPSARYISTTMPKMQEAEARAEVEPSPLPEAEDMELIVRQAKAQFGDTLPKGYLNDEELRLYTRLYGAPLRDTRPEDVGMPVGKALLRETHKYTLLDGKNMLLKENDDGELEEVPYSAPGSPPQNGNPENIEGEYPQQPGEVSVLPSDAGIDYIKAVAKNQREFDALLELQRDFEIASLGQSRDGRDEEQKAYEEEEQEDDEDDIDGDDDDGEPDVVLNDKDRVHEFSQLGQWGTTPSTLHLPKAEFVSTIQKLLRRTDVKHIRESAEKAFGGPGLPHSVATPATGRDQGQKPVTMEAGHHRMSEIEADAYIATMLPGMYASVMSVLVETRKRMGPHWLQRLLARADGEGPRVLDVGAGGAGLAAWDRVLRTEWELLHGPDGRAYFGPPGKKTVVVGNENLRHRVSRFLHNTTFLPRLPDYLHSGEHPELLTDSVAPKSRKQFDLIIASHLLMPLKAGFQRKQMLDNLWEMLSPEGGVLIIMEKGHPRGFEAVADARQRLLDEFIETQTSDPQPDDLEPQSRRAREPGMIIAPCTNHKKCPMYLTPGLAQGRKDFCHFSQRFIRPPFLQSVLEASHRNHEDIDFSFVAVQRGVTATSPNPAPKPALGARANDVAFRGYEDSTEPPNPLTLPRSIIPPLKRKGHVTLDLCTPAGTIERWTIPKSFSKQAYHDARKAEWGDLWALGAKTRVVRPVRLGKGGVAPNDGGVRARRAEAAAKKKAPKVVNVEAQGVDIFKVQGGTGYLGGRGPAPVERRTKGGKKLRLKRVKDVMDEFA